MNAIAATHHWLEHAVIRLNLCPLARAVHVKRQIPPAESPARDEHPAACRTGREGSGLDLNWYVVLFAVYLQTSFLTPPVGFSLFYMRGVAPKEITTQHIFCGVIPFVLIHVLAVGLTFLYPKLVTWLPELMYGVQR